MSFFKKIAALLQPKPVEQLQVDQSPVMSEPIKAVPTLVKPSEAPAAPKKKRTYIKRDESAAPAQVATVKKTPVKKPAAPKKAK